MKLNEKYSIEKEAHGFSLVEKTTIEVTKDGKKTGKVKNGEKKRFYGSVYQTLQGFLTVSIDDAIEGDLIDETLKVLQCIDKASELIKDNFCIEVKRC